MRDSIFVSKTDKPMNWRSLSSRINLLESAEDHLSPFADGFHVVWDQHRFSLLDGGAQLDPATIESAMNLVRQSSMETWPPPNQKQANMSKERLSIAANDFFNYLNAGGDERLRSTDAGGVKEEFVKKPENGS